MLKRYLFLLLLLPPALITTARFCHHQTAGFCMAKVQNNLYHHGPFPLPPLSPEEQEQVSTIVQQKFTYLGRGKQSFAFVSEDGKWVLKLFQNHNQQRIAWIKLLPLPIFLDKWRSHKIEIERHKINKVFHSYRLAYEELRRETGLLYLHPCATNHLHTRATIVDRLHIAHQIDLDQTGFLLQRRAELAYPYFARLLAAGKQEEAKQSIHSLLQLLVHRCQKGIADNDPLIRTNFGFVGNQPIEIDVGPFSKEIAISQPVNYRPEIERITASLKDWLSHNHPELVSYLEQELCELFATSSS